MSRKRRGMRTQALLAQRWRHMGLYPSAVDAGAGRPGKDILNTPGLAVEVKARGRFTLLETLRQAEGNATGAEIPIVVWRHNGQGEKSMGDWTVSMRLSTFEAMWELLDDLWRQRHGISGNGTHDRPGVGPGGSRGSV